MPTDTTEKELENLIVAALTGNVGAGTGASPNVVLVPPAVPGNPVRAITGDCPNPRDCPPAQTVQDGRVPYRTGLYVGGASSDYDKEFALDRKQLLAFLEATQPATCQSLGLDVDGPQKTQFLARLSQEIGKRGVVDVLRHGVKHGPAHVTLFYGSATPGNMTAAELYAENRFSLTRQLHFSPRKPNDALDLALFINGLPLFTFELKNHLTGQTVGDAVKQYQNDRDAKDLLFQFKRCLAHWAVDDCEVKFCTRLEGEASWFLPFNKGCNDGAGNPPNPDGLMSDYLWREFLTRERLTDILENYAKVIKETNPQTGKVVEKQVFPRYHQLDVVRKLLADVRQNGAGQRYLIQHSAGSGKSNSIAWLAHQLVGLERNGATVFDSIIVINDRRLLDKQTYNTIKAFMQVGATVGHTDDSNDLRDFITGGKQIIITTVQKFPFVLDKIGNDHRDRKFALLIDEAHSSQSGSASAKMSMVLSEVGADGEEETTEDKILRILESRKLLPNASYFSFTATPKPKTLEMFGVPTNDNSEKKFRPFHAYTMKQAIQEGFILDVLKYYTPVKSYYRLMKTVEDDPEFDVKRAQKRLRGYVEGHAHAIGEKAEIMVEHFHAQVIAKGKIGGQARAMVVTGGIARAIAYYHAISKALQARQSPYKAVVAFTGEHEYGGQKVTEATLNGFPSNDIESKIRQDPYRFLICADKFQTGYDEPLLHTMYVDKSLAGIKAVQTLSRLNRSHPKKHDTFVLDFFNETDAIQAAFQDYYQTTILSRESDPNRLHDLKATMDAHPVYTPEQVDALVELYLNNASRPALDAILDACAKVYETSLDTNAQIEFKGSAKAFVRNYNFLAAILPYSLPEWEKLSLFLTLLVPKLPAPQGDDLAEGILETIDMDSYRAEQRTMLSLSLEAHDAEIDPSDVGGSGHALDPELDRLSRIISQFNDLFGSIPFDDQDKILKLITEDIPAKVAANVRYQNAMQHSDKQSAEIEHDLALEHVLIALIKDNTELYKQFKNNAEFQRFITNVSFQRTYQPPQP